MGDKVKIDIGVGWRRITLLRMSIEPAEFRTEHLEFRPFDPAGDISSVPAGEGWPHANTVIGMRLAAQHNQPFWLVLLDGSAIGDCGTVGPPDANGTVEIGVGISESYEQYRAEMIRGLTNWLRTQPGIIDVTGESEIVVPEPAVTLSEPTELLGQYLDYYREAILRKLAGLTDEQLRTSTVASGWTPLGLLNHLTMMELRWFRWGFVAEAIADPWGGGGPGSDWKVSADRPTSDVFAAFRAQIQRSREIVAGVPLDTVAATGGRFSEYGDRPTLAWILFHVLQEYARHTGQLDVVRETIDGTTGE